MRILSLIAVNFLFCLLASGQKLNQVNDTVDFVSIEHIGVSDKPIKFIISHQKLTNDSLISYNMVLKIDKDIFDITCALVEKENTFIRKVERRNFGVFQIVMRQHGKKISYLLPSREYSIDYFLKLKYFLDKEIRADMIVYEIETVLSRIR